MSFAANRAWPIDVRVELQQKQHAVIGDVLDALAHLEDLAENKLERSRLVACRIDDDDPALIEAILDDGDALDQALRRGAPGVRLVVYEVADVDDAIPARCARAASPATSEDLTARGSSEDLEASIDPDQRCVVRVSLRALVDMNEDDGLYFLSSATPELLGAPFAVRLSQKSVLVQVVRGGLVAHQEVSGRRPGRGRGATAVSLFVETVSEHG